MTNMMRVTEPRNSVYYVGFTWTGVLLFTIGTLCPVSAEQERSSYMIELHTEAACRLYGEKIAAKSSVTERNAAVTSRIAVIDAEQEAVKVVVSAKCPRVLVICQVHNVFNGIAVKATAEEVKEILTLPGVKAVHPLPPMRLNLETSVPFISTPSVWDMLDDLNVSHLTGQGTTIGIIDTGIDYKHPDFGGTSSTTWETRDTNKIMGGIDVVGDNYDGVDPLTVQPDDDPMDQDGHGTHVAGIAAGYGVINNGTHGAQNDVWSSTDGVAWTQSPQHAPWPGRLQHASVVFDNKIWVIGGRSSLDDPSSGMNDVWCWDSSTGWVQKTANANWSPRYGHSCVVYNDGESDRMWLMGGINGSPEYTTNYLNDVWFSDDGVAWTIIDPTEHEGEGDDIWSPRHSHSSLVYDGKIWVLGGIDGQNQANYLSEVWSAALDGDTLNWTKTTAPWPGRGGHTSAVFDNKIWLLGGARDGLNYLRDVWVFDGSWSSVSSGTAPWLARHLQASVVHDGSIWILGGKTFPKPEDDEENPERPPWSVDDVWSRTAASDWTERTDEAPWRGRFGHTAVTLYGIIWLLGGNVFGGVPYQGNYDSSLDFQDEDMIIGPGTAPEAKLFVVKVFGSGKRVDSPYVIQAIDRCMNPDNDEQGNLDDHVDVINMSLGWAFGRFDDAVSSEVIRAVNEAGCIVVAAAGNDGDIFFASGSPAAAAGAITVAASVDPEPLMITDSLADFSSRGPAFSSDGRIQLKPDVSAPGYTILSAAAAIGYDFSYMTTKLRESGRAALFHGTSMASPLVAGLTALLRQQREWQPNELKALIMNTANHDVTRGENGRMDPGRAGAGRVDIVQAAASRSIAYDGDHPDRVSITFDTIEVFRQASETRTIRLENKGDIEAEFTVSLSEVATNAGVTLAIDAPALVTLEPYTYAEFRISLTADATLMTHSHAPTVDEVINGDLEMEHRPRFWLSEVSGYVKFDSQTIGQSDLRLPYYAALRPVSDMRAENELLDFTSSATQDIELHGVHVDTNHESEMGIKSLVSVFELLYVDTQAPPQWGNEAWVRLIGAASNYPDKLAEYGDEEEALANTTVFFALATEGDWATLHPWSVRFIFHVGVGVQPPLVVQNDVLNVVAGRLEGDDIFLAYPGEPGFKNPVVFLMNPSMYLDHLPPSDYDTRPFLTNVIVFPVLASALNIDYPENAKIHLLVESLVVDRDGNKPILGQWPESGFRLAYDVANPGLSFGGSSRVPGDPAPIFFDMDAASIEVTYNGC